MTPEQQEAYLTGSNSVYEGVAIKLSDALAVATDHHDLYLRTIAIMEETRCHILDLAEWQYRGDSNEPPPHPRVYKAVQ